MDNTAPDETRDKQKKYWIKLYVESVEDPKLAKLPDNLWRRFIECLMLAGMISEDGFLPTLADMAFTLRKQETSLQHELEQLAKAGLVEIKPYDLFESRWFVTKFANRQAPSPGAIRQKRHRDSKKEKSPQSPLKEKEEKDRSDTDTYCNVTNNVTSNVTSNADAEHEAKIQEYWQTSLELLERWKVLTGNFRRMSPSDPFDRDDYYAPALALIDQHGGDLEKTWNVVKAEYNRMVGANMTIKRLSAITPGIAAAKTRATLPRRMEQSQQVVVMAADPTMPARNKGGAW